MGGSICWRQMQADFLMGLSEENSRDKNDNPVRHECILPDRHDGWHLTSLLERMFGGPHHLMWTTEGIACDCPKETSDVCDCFDFAMVSPERAQKMIQAASKGEV